MTMSAQSLRRDGIGLAGGPPVAVFAAERVLALLPEPETVESCLRAAVAVAGGCCARVEALHVGFDPRFVRASAEEIGMQALRELEEGSADHRLQKIRAAFDRFEEAAPVHAPIAWKIDEGDIDENICAEAEGADLVVIGRPIHLDAHDALHSVIFHARRPTLLVPRTLAPGPLSIGRRIVIGWKPTKSVQRAVVALLPWLRRADGIAVVCIRTPSRQPYEASAREFFATLGIEVEIISLEKDSRSVGDRLIAETKRLGGDSLLIGAFEHGLFWQIVLGGVTRDVLAHADIPVFMMH